MTFCLYRHFDKNEKLLYVGVSLSFLQRTAHHKTRTYWWSSIDKITIEKFKTRKASIDAETLAIEIEKPKFNINKKRRNIKCVNRGNGNGIKDIVSCKEAAKILNITFSYLWKMRVRAGIGPDFFIVRNVVKYSKKDLNKYLKALSGVKNTCN